VAASVEPAAADEPAAAPAADGPVARRGESACATRGESATRAALAGAQTTPEGCCPERTQSLYVLRTGLAVLGACALATPANATSAAATAMALTRCAEGGVVGLVMVCFLSGSACKKFRGEPR
jgi:hypothetical protein